MSGCMVFGAHLPSLYDLSPIVYDSNGFDCRLELEREGTGSVSVMRSDWGMDALLSSSV